MSRLLEYAFLGTLAIFVLSLMPARWWPFLMVLVCAFNFMPLLFNPQGPREVPFWLFMVRDVILICAVVSIFLRKVPRREGFSFLPREIAFAMGLWCFYTLVRAINPGTSVLAIVRFLRYLVIYPLLAAFVGVNSLRERREFEKLAVFTLGVGFVVAILALAQPFVPAFRPYTRGMFDFLFGERAVSALGNPNNLGAFLGMTTIFAFFMLVEGGFKSTVGRGAAIFLIVLNLFALFLTLSRGAATALALTSLILLGFKRPAKSRIAKAGLAFLFLAGIGFFYVFTALRGAEAIKSRAYKIPYNLELMSRNPAYPFVGMGVGRGYATGEAGEELKLEAIDITKADNFYLMVFVEEGLAGLFFFGLLLIVTAKSLARRYLMSGEGFKRAWLGAALFELIYVAIWGIGAVSFRLFPAGFIVWLFLGLAIRAELLPEPERGEEVFRWPRPRESAL